MSVARSEIGAIPATEPTARTMVDDRVKACMHMLRHIDNVRELRKNPLAAPLFSHAAGSPGSSASRHALATLRRLLTLAVEHLRSQPSRRIKPAQIERQHAIVTRFDLAGERAEAVAADLEISMRQFNRDHRSACSLIAPEIERLIHEETREPAWAFDRFSMAFARATTLRLTGSIDAALGKLRSLLAEGQGEKQAAVLARLVHILLDDNRIDEAERELDAAPFYNITELLRAHVDWARGNGNSDCDRDQRLLTTIDLLASSPNALWRELACTALLAWSEHESLLGRFAARQAHLRRVDAIAVRLTDPSPYLQVDLLLQSAAHQYYVAHREDRAREHLDRLSRMARRFGFIEAAANVLCAESMIVQESGSLERALQLSREAEQLSQNGAASLARADVLSRACELEAEIGNASRSLELSLAAAKLLDKRSYQGMGARLATARVYELLGNHALAEREAMQLYTDASAGGSGRLAGSALRLVAETQSKLGKTREATEVIAEAIALLERHGQPFSLCRAYDISAHVTGNREHASRAREIRALYRTG